MMNGFMMTAKSYVTSSWKLLRDHMKRLKSRPRTHGNDGCDHLNNHDNSTFRHTIGVRTTTTMLGKGTLMVKNGLCTNTILILTKETLLLGFLMRKSPRNPDSPGRNEPEVIEAPTLLMRTIWSPLTWGLPSVARFKKYVELTGKTGLPSHVPISSFR